MPKHNHTMDKPNTGALFYNDRKEKATQPTYRGHFTTESGNKYSLAAWIDGMNNSGINQGIMFRNPSKNDSKHPDFIGKLNSEEGMIYLSGWERESKAGNQYISIATREWIDKDQERFKNIPDQIFGLAMRDWQ